MKQQQIKTPTPRDEFHAGNFGHWEYQYHNGTWVAVPREKQPLKQDIQ